MGTRLGALSTYRLCNNAAAAGDLKMVSITAALFTPRSEALVTAISNGHMHIYRHLRRLDVRPDPKCITAAAKRGDREIIEELRSDGCSFEAKATLEALRSGHEALCRWLLDSGCPAHRDLLEALVTKRGGFDLG